MQTFKNPGVAWLLHRGFVLVGAVMSVSWRLQRIAFLEFFSAIFSFRIFLHDFFSTRRGKVLAVFDTLVDGKVVRSPDNPAITTPGAPGGTMDIQVRRSRGFEGMAAAKDGSKLYALLEGAVWNSTTKANESEGGNDNNLPFSSSRLPNKADDNELILLEVDEFLRAK